VSEEVLKAQKQKESQASKDDKQSGAQAKAQAAAQPSADSEASYAQFVTDIIDSNLCVAARFEKSGTCVFASIGCEDAFGIAPHEMIGRRLTDILRQFDPKLCTCCDALKTAIAEGVRTECTCAVTLHGVQKMYLVMMAPEKFACATSSYVDAVFVDISRCLDTFHSLKHAAINKERFIGIVAHELRNPLSAIASGLKILAATSGNAETIRLREMMERQIAHLSRLVHDLLDMSRINEAKLTLTKTKVLLSEVLSLAIETAQSSIRKGKHELRVNVPEEPIELHVDSSRVAQVISNLLDNASKYTPEGGMITLQVTHAQEDLVISVRDNGTGIKPEHKDGIFRQFMQVDGDSRRSRGGLGLGLYLVKMIVQAHGGLIEAISDGEGQGSEFVVRLPV